MIAISVIVPVFNNEKYIESCVDSIINQNMSNIEIILVNDGSTDGSCDLIERLSLRDERIKALHKSNGGPGSSRNMGMDNAQGEYISFIDSDDWIETNFLNDMYIIGKKYDADIISTGIKVNYAKEKRIHEIKFPENSCAENMEIGKLFWELHKNKLSNYPVTRIYKKELLQKNNLKFSTELSVGEDLIFNLQAFAMASKVCVNNSASYHYMKREIATLTSGYNPNYKEGSLLQIEAYKTFFAIFSLQNSEQLEFMKTFINIHNVGLVTNLFKRNNPYGFFERNKILKNEIFNSGLKKSELMSCKAGAIQDRIFLITYLSRSSIIMNIVFSILFFLRNNFEFLYLRFRRSYF